MRYTRHARSNYACDVEAARARRFDKAAYSLQTGMQLGKDIGSSPLLITGLVGLAVAGTQSGQIDEWLQTPGSPNLYWSLTDLPRPFIDMHKPLQGERLCTRIEHGIVQRKGPGQERIGTAD